ncbi:capsid assembly scaffolding protein Gp46 family protein [Levilactobacillus enshiensis]|uniref:capsid assembly scaffolding protein Gp46 family protein n=1 Tax=Levilactobacillus enshiensis TaxID=2590213 RepID=UPI001179E20B|nr:DUF4355 domain-containing protein [Levilactobacillus enshiensis]
MKFYSDVLNLQRFAEEGGNDNGGNATDDNQGGNDGTGSNDDGADTTITFKDQSELDSWYDKKFAKSASKLKETWNQEQTQNKAYEDMSPAEKRKFDDDKREKSLADREQKLVIGENRAGISERLAKDGLPVGLVKVFEPALSDTKNLDDTYQAISDVYRESVKSGVDKKLADSANVPGAAGSSVSASAGKTAAEERNKQNSKPSKSMWD